MSEKKFIASQYVNQITHRKVTPMDERFPRGTYHDTWADAHDAIVAKRQQEFEKAQRTLANATRSLAKAKAMKEPKQ